MRPVDAVAVVTGCVDRKLRNRPISLERLCTVGSHASEHVQVAVEPHARRHGVRHGFVVPRVDVVVDDRDELDEVHGLEGRERDGAGLTRIVRSERDHGGQAPGAALGHGHGAHRRFAQPQPALQARGDRNAPEHRVLGVKARQDGLVERVAPACQATERHRRRGAVALVAAVELRDRALLDGVVEVELALQDDLAPGGRLERNAQAAHELDGLAQQRACDAQLVLAAREVETCCDQQRRVIADRDSDRQALAPLVRGSGGHREVMVGRDADECPRSADRPHARDRPVALSGLGIRGRRCSRP